MLILNFPRFLGLLGLIITCYCQSDVKVRRVILFAGSTNRSPIEEPKVDIIST